MYENLKRVHLVIIIEVQNWFYKSAYYTFISYKFITNTEKNNFEQNIYIGIPYVY